MLGSRFPESRKRTSTNHHTPRPPRVSSLATPRQQYPRQNRSMPQKPRNTEKNRMVGKNTLLYLQKEAGKWEGMG